VLLEEVAEEIVMDEEKEKSFKIGYITLYTKLFHTHRLRIVTLA
jgi:hypothetical protein